MSTARHTDAVLDEMANASAIGLRARADILRRLTDPAQRDEAVSRMHRLMNRVPGRPSDLLNDCVNDIIRGVPEYRTDQERESGQ
ncbi:hypothetical protein [Nocardia cyriacigeorgica]|uniref:hypothetical protein n=1 Tax=Nocardia cyriacigeorgica TaxID=135487 RepID=UPI0024583265|nr:hypothetical protein [Nocardia cyriacigeorgica]